MQADNQLGRDMLCVCGAAAIAEENHFAIVLQRGRAGLSKLRDSRKKFSRKAFFHSCALAKLVLNSFGPIRHIFYLPTKLKISTERTIKVRKT